MSDNTDQAVNSAAGRSHALRDVVSIAASFAVLSALYWAAVFLLCGRAGFPLDDSFIHLQFARNLWHDGQMAFNAGAPSSGSTAPLYPLFLVVFYQLLGNWYAASYLLGASCSLGTALVVYGIVRSWTGQHRLARWAGTLTVLVSPTIVQAYGGMEAPVYSLLFLLGLWCYPSPRLRFLSSGIWSLGIWLRPELMILLPLMLLERFLSARRRGAAWFRALAVESAPHAAIWIAMLLVYGAYHYHQDRHLIPTTFAAKSVAPGVPKPVWADSLPAAATRGDWGLALLAIGVWPVVVLLSVAGGIALICAPLAFGMRRAIVVLWRGAGPASCGWRLAILTFLGYPWARGLVDTLGVFMFQQQRYYAHLTPLAILLVVGALPATGTLVRSRWWNWADVPEERQKQRTVRWAWLGFCLTGAVSVISVSNINSMQVTIGEWIQRHSARDQLIAANDIGAIAFVSGRPILDTVGLVEPELVEHYLSGGTLSEYLLEHDPAYVVIFPGWYPRLSGREDLLEETFSVNLKLNVVCGGSRMVVYRFKQ